MRRKCFRTIPGMFAFMSYGVPNIEDSPRHMIRNVFCVFPFRKSVVLNSGTRGVIAGKYFLRKVRLVWYHVMPSNDTVSAGAAGIRGENTRSPISASTSRSSRAVTGRRLKMIWRARMVTCGVRSSGKNGLFGRFDVEPIKLRLDERDLKHPTAEAQETVRKHG